ncbi:MAG: McrBC 5-methylcytosine restriction system component [uncultured Sulfurovum sp.]|uniref:McrBC 5-methylcytosine restriction system component n=1 Tax=uncultured Sulfurovum sp. TaxID=269237 RepID=A0A6S6UD91_9BACT|nr:MAG: McrBC 5-methylcytosine restriction system component [uncultured Sulfurovum sp.]
MKSKEPISVFEHDTLYVRKNSKFDTPQFEALKQYYGDNGVPYFSLGNNSVRFNQYVGVIQVGGTVIEVLPKADKSGSKGYWRDMLIDMLRSVGIFKVHAPSSSSLKLKPNSILDLYIELYVQELEYLLHRGLIKRYRKQNGNKTALKGKLVFAKHIQKNVTHQERFYVRYTTYSKEHLIHQILYKALTLIKRINKASILKSRIGALTLNFPEMPDIKVIEASFEKISYNRKNEHYKKALDIAKLLLLNYHPDLMKGRNDVLALMFNMNRLWESFVFESLRKGLSKEKGKHTIKREPQKRFWELKTKKEKDKKEKTVMKPDIVLNYNGASIILDAKWKNINGKKSSPHDLRQMYVYLDYYKGDKVALVYPNTPFKQGYFMDVDGKKQNKNKECSIVGIKLPDENKNISTWQNEIYENIRKWIET